MYKIYIHEECRIVSFRNKNIKFKTENVKNKLNLHKLQKQKCSKFFIVHKNVLTGIKLIKLSNESGVN